MGLLSSFNTNLPLILLICPIKIMDMDWTGYNWALGLSLVDQVGTYRGTDKVIPLENVLTHFCVSHALQLETVII